MNGYNAETYVTVSGYIASSVANNATFTLAYPAGVTASDLASISGDYSAHMLVGNNDKYVYGSSGFTLVFGTSVITVTNKTGATLPLNSLITLTIPVSDATAGSTTLTKSTNHTLVLTDAGKFIRMDSASAQTLTVPPESTVPFPNDTEIGVEQSGAGVLTIVAGSGVTIDTPASLELNGQYATAALKKIGTNNWVLAGRLV